MGDARFKGHVLDGTMVREDERAVGGPGPGPGPGPDDILNLKILKIF